ncbi:hypothetical protein E2C01_053617 [Portunus trituberculatus]|uniref:Uncharacterized protein n=1 Tax=Portunus trituberculatus TaxID=210409 RepID=A0A5B7GPU9_PORTR|nr:hypothetical protein [Portunus trituberculatus]
MFVSTSDIKQDSTHFINREATSTLQVLTELKIRTLVNLSVTVLPVYQLLCTITSHLGQSRYEGRLADVTMYEHLQLTVPPQLQLLGIQMLPCHCIFTKYHTSSISAPFTATLTRKVDSRSYRLDHR